MHWFEDPGYDSWNNVSLKLLNVDEAYLNITLADNVPRPIYLYKLASECENCPFVKLESYNTSQLTKINTNQFSSFRLYSNDENEWKSADDFRKLFCDLESKIQFGEFGVYDLIVENNKTCKLKVSKDPVNIWYSLIFWIFILIGFLVLYKISKHYLFKRSSAGDDNNESDNSKAHKKKRIKSLDTFRGIAISLMIFVNFGAGSYRLLDHAAWNGIQAADLVFPWFLWIMGVTIPIVISSKLRRNINRHKIFQKIVKRSVILFVLNIMLNSFTNPNLDTLRINGVLQRFACTYLVVSGFATYFTFRPDSKDSRLPSFIKDVVLFLPQWIIHVTIFCLHGWITFHIIVPGCPRGYIGPGGVQDNGKYFNCTGGAANYFDMILIGSKRFWDQGPARKVYQSIAYDPEPLLGTLSSIFHVFLGSIAGNVLLYHKNTLSRVKRWLMYGFICLVIAFYLVQFRQIPINKQLWSSSFVLFTSGISFLLLSGLYVVIDHFKLWDGSPFFYAGMNPTILYIGHSIGVMVPFVWHISPSNTHFILLFQNIWTVLMWLLVAKWLHHKQLFLSF